MYNTNGIYNDYNSEAAANWEVMPLRDMFNVMNIEPKKTDSRARTFHKINFAIALVIKNKKQQKEELCSDLLSRLGAWQHKGECSINEITAFVEDIINLGVNVSCADMKEAAHVHYKYAYSVVYDSVIEAVYMAHGLDTK